jgi:hypothetical protein
LPAASTAALAATTLDEIEAAQQKLDVVEEAAKNARWFTRRAQDELMAGPQRRREVARGPRLLPRRIAHGGHRRQDRWRCERPAARADARGVRGRVP